MTDVERWLEPRLAGVPEALRERILGAVRGETGNGKRSPSRLRLQDGLRGVGERLLAEAIAMPPSRDTAITLLAADALMTFACEALAELDPDGLAGAR